MKTQQRLPQLRSEGTKETVSLLYPSPGINGAVRRKAIEFMQSRVLCLWSFTLLLAKMKYLYAFVLEVAVWVYVVINTPSIQFIGFCI